MHAVTSQEIPPFFNHQNEAAEFLILRNGFGMLAHDPGLGKTRTALEVYRRAKIKTPNLKLLIIAPLSLLEAAWHNDIEKFFPGQWSFWNIRTNGAPFRWEADVYAVNYEFFQKEEKIKLLLSTIRAQKVMAVLDESSKIKNHSAITTKHLLAIRSLFDLRVVMSGTPAPNDESEYWAQLEFVRPGLLWGSFNKFRRTYFYLRGRNGQAINTQGMVLSRQVMSDLYSKQGAEYAITDDSRRKLFETIGPWIHAAKKEECLDLPEQVDEVRLVQMGQRQKVAYNQMKRHLVAEIEGQDVVAQVALAKLMKLREITSGFAISENQEIVETECPKLTELEEILDELGDRQVIIWGNFTYEIEKIKDALERRTNAQNLDRGDGESNGVVTLFGGTKDREKSINDFINGKARYLVANPHSAAHGLTFVNCSYQIFFSLDYSSEAFIQAKARTHRAGQKSTCVYYYILADGTIDQEVFGVLKRKGDMQELVFRLREKMKP